MSENINYGWIRARPKREKIKTTAENILSDFFPPTIKDMRHSGHQISKCIYRGDTLLADFEGKNKSERYHIVLDLSERCGEVLKLGTPTKEKIVTIREEVNSDFKRYFEFETVCDGKMSVWEIGIIRWVASSQGEDF